jgi:hypothetical protein
MPTYLNSTTKIIALPYASNFKKHKFSIAPGESLETTLYLTSTELTNLGLTKSSEEPFSRISNSVTNLIFVGAGTQSVIGLVDSKIIRVKTDIDITIIPNDVTNPYYYPLGSLEGFVDIKNEREIDILFITALEAGSIWVIELRD